jgi:hypothetical protein
MDDCNNEINTTEMTVASKDIHYCSFLFIVIIIFLNMHCNIISLFSSRSFLFIVIFFLNMHRYSCSLFSRNINNTINKTLKTERKITS